jgi:SnoaL-like domain
LGSDAVNKAEPDERKKSVGEALSIAAICARLARLEDRLDILNLLAALPHSSDVGDQDFQNRTYHDDCVMDRNNADNLIVGKTAIVDIIDSEPHRKAIQTGMVHFAGLPNIRIEGEGDGARATATGYIQIVVPIAAGLPASEEGPELSGYGPSDGLAIWRLTANQWELEKDGGSWKVIRRIIRSVPGRGVHEIIAAGLK